MPTILTASIIHTVLYTYNGDGDDGDDGDGDGGDDDDGDGFDGGGEDGGGEGGDGGDDDDGDDGCVFVSRQSAQNASFDLPRVLAIQHPAKGRKTTAGLVCVMRNGS